MNECRTSEDLQKALTHYLDTYFVKRDFETTLTLLSPRVSGYGTGLDEASYGFKDFKELYLRDITQAPDAINYSIISTHIESPLNKLGIVSCELNIQTHILNQELKINNLRLSIVFVKVQDIWLIQHMHISLPTTAHEHEESYPVKELENRNIVLQRLVDRKTTELNNANQELQKRLKEIKTLSGLLPICASCKKIRDDKGYWNQIEDYITTHSEAQFSHSVCPQCCKKLYPELYDEIMKKPHPG